MRTARSLALVATLTSLACRRAPPAAAPPPAAVAAAPVPAAPLTSGDAPPRAWCYVFHRDAPAGNFSNCFDDEARCRALVAARRAVFEEQGGRFERLCEPSPEATCAVATDDAGRVTFRSCAATRALCEEQQQRAARMARTGFVAGPRPACRSATRDDLAHDPAARAPGAVGP